ncbi:hypothetical protein FO519_003814 [Halicephalobus sp. NKZ332]|nr:hypothetical protein FO519_003814 [Halicephalobus sp. NKZ332]
MAWRSLPAAAKNVQFAHNSALFKWTRYISWNYLWGGREYGLLWHDQYFEPAPEVTEALRRLNLKEPWLFDQRKMRLSRAHTMTMHNEILPKDQWTKWEDETFYLKPYLDEIEAEKKERARSSGLIPGYLLRKEAGDVDRQSIMCNWYGYVESVKCCCQHCNCSEKWKTWAAKKQPKKYVTPNCLRLGYNLDGRFDPEHIDYGVCLNFVHIKKASKFLGVFMIALTVFNFVAFRITDVPILQTASLCYVPWTFFLNIGIWRRNFRMIVPFIVSTELKDIMEAKDTLFKPTLIDEKNIFHWEILLMPNKEPYHKGGFKISIDFPADYPFRPPKLTFLTKIYHPNVDEKGKICLGIIAPHHWKPATKVEQILQSLLSLIMEPDLENPLRADLAEEYQQDKKKFFKSAEEYTKKYSEKI